MCSVQCWGPNCHVLGWTWKEDLEGYGLGQQRQRNRNAASFWVPNLDPRETRQNLTDGPAVDFANPFPPKRVPPETSGGLWGIFMDIHYWGCLCFCRVSTKFRPHIFCWWLFWQTLELAHQHLLSMKFFVHLVPPLWCLVVKAGKGRSWQIPVQTMETFLGT